MTMIATTFPSHVLFFLGLCLCLASSQGANTNDQPTSSTDYAFGFVLYLFPFFACYIYHRHQLGSIRFLWSGFVTRKSSCKTAPTRTPCKNPHIHRSSDFPFFFSFPFSSSSDVNDYKNREKYILLQIWTFDSKFHCHSKFKCLFRKMFHRTNIFLYYIGWTMTTGRAFTLAIASLDRFKLLLLFGICFGFVIPVHISLKSFDASFR